MPERTFEGKDRRARRYDRPMPADVRYRCTACGNLTRFDITTTRRSRAFHHYTLGGEVDVEDEEILGETVEAVECRWCGTGEHVAELTAAEADAAAAAGEGASA
jgi:hypothetical protein